MLHASVKSEPGKGGHRFAGSAVPAATLAAPALAAEPEGRVSELFGQWQLLVDAIYQADRESEDDEFFRAIRAEPALKDAIAEATPLSLRELHGGLRGHVRCLRPRRTRLRRRMLAEEIAWKWEHGRDEYSFPWRIPAFALAAPLMRMAMADPNGPRQPTTPLPEV